jgi:reactive intermediate/imine deaminase
LLAAESKEVGNMSRRSLGQNVGSYSQGVVVSGGQLVFVAGQIATDANGNVVGRGDLVAQSRAVVDKIRRIVEEAGGSMDNVVKITTFVTTLEGYSEFAQVRAEYFPNHKPASATVRVSGLIGDDFLIEIEAIAVLQ